MLNLIPLEYYTNFYFIVLSIVIVLFYIYTQFVSFETKIKFNKQYLKFLGYFALFFTILYMGLRPISGRYFGDMSTYNAVFEQLKIYGTAALPSNDKFYYYYMYIVSIFGSAEFFFLLSSFLYTIPLFLASKRIFGKYWCYAFLVLVSSLSFWAYGTNGLRNGLAASIFLLVFSFKNIFIRLILLIIAVSIHSSMLIPLAAYILASTVKRVKLLLYGWLLAIPLSLVAGGFFQGLFASLIQDDRTSYLTEGNINNDSFSSTGFRWDFLIYSAVPVLIGYIFAIRNQSKDRLYEVILGTYLISNAFWILVIKANFSNRFAYLSWFMMGLVIVYPFLYSDHSKRKHQILGHISLVYFLFAFIMNMSFK